jgi:serine phosphatase RsbU (regulator of sigma subunit)
MEEFKIKIYGIIPVTRKQFVYGYTFFFLAFIAAIVYLFFFPLEKSLESDSFFKKIFSDYAILTFLFFLIWIIIEGIIYWDKFIKAQKRIIENQKNDIEVRNQYLEQHKEEITSQRDEITAQRDEIEAQRDLVVSQMSTITHQKKELTDSIEYAYRIQCALLPPEHYLNQCLPNSFILYMPKDVVSGDFFFVEQANGYTVVAAVDCTGHGVPGAMMSVIGYNLLNQAVKINRITRPSDILGFLDVGVTEILRQAHNESGVKDGMDLSVVSIDNQMRTFEYAGAYNSIYYIHNKELIEVKADKFPIGVNEDEVGDVYTNNGLPVSKGDMVYLFSDGYADQFGGPKGKKLKYKQLEEILIQVCDEPVDVQKQYLKKRFLDWKGNEEQVDDILVIGIRV